MNEHLRSKLPLDAIEVCTHDDADNCDCRKPKPGLLLRAAQRDGIDARSKASWWATAGATSRRVTAPNAAPFSSATAMARNSRRNLMLAVGTLSEAADWILKQPVKARD